MARLIKTSGRHHSHDIACIVIMPMRGNAILPLLCIRHPLLLQGIWYFFGTRPSPFFGITDFYVLNPISRRIGKTWRVADLGLRERLGGGNFGQVYEGIIANKDIDIKKVKQLTSKQKKRRVVLKKVNLDNVVVRADFLRAGTMAKVSCALQHLAGACNVHITSSGLHVCKPLQYRVA